MPARGSSRSFRNSRSARWPGPAGPRPGSWTTPSSACPALGWDGLAGADADHLKTTEDVEVTAAVGFTFFTIAPSGFVDAHADDYDEPTLRAKFAGVSEEVRWVDSYKGRSVPLAAGTVVQLDEEACRARP